VISFSLAKKHHCHAWNHHVCCICCNHVPPYGRYVSSLESFARRWLIVILPLSIYEGSIWKTNRKTYRLVIISRYKFASIWVAYSTFRQIHNVLTCHVLLSNAAIMSAYFWLFHLTLSHFCGWWCSHTRCVNIGNWEFVIDVTRNLAYKVAGMQLL